MSQSRYASVGTAVYTTPDGRQVPYLLRRLLPAPSAFATRKLHAVRPGERYDTIAATELGDAGLSWLLADANAVMSQGELARPGRTIRIPLPAGVPAPPHAQ
jgi:hypothetical protein